MDEREIWSLRIKEARTSDQLGEIDRALAVLNPLWRTRCQIEIAAKRLRLKRIVAERSGGENCFAAAYGVSAADGRWIHAYRLSNEAFERLGRDLSGRQLPTLAVGNAPALFVLWAAEWFRRSYRGGGHRWADLCRALGTAEDRRPRPAARHHAAGISAMAPTRHRRRMGLRISRQPCARGWLSRRRGGGRRAWLGAGCAARRGGAIAC